MVQGSMHSGELMAFLVALGLLNVPAGLVQVTADLERARAGAGAAFKVIDRTPALVREPTRFRSGDSRSLLRSGSEPTGQRFEGFEPGGRSRRLDCSRGAQWGGKKHSVGEFDAFCGSLWRGFEFKEPAWKHSTWRIAGSVRVGKSGHRLLRGQLLVRLGRRVHRTKISGGGSRLKLMALLIAFRRGTRPASGRLVQPCREARFSDSVLRGACSSSQVLFWMRRRRQSMANRAAVVPALLGLQKRPTVFVSHRFETLQAC